MHDFSLPNDAEGPAGMKMNRRQFLCALGASGALLSSGARALGLPSASQGIKPVSGSWFEFQHHATIEGVDWNPMCARFTCEQWDAKIKEIAEAGMEYLVLMASALDYRSFFPTKIFPEWQLNCPEPLETVLSAADRYGVKFFIGGGFYGDWTDSHIITDSMAARRRLQAIEEITNLYGHHRSFYGWYWPNEAFIDRYYSEEFIGYVNACSRLARQLAPKARILIAPYGTRVAVPDDKYVRQLESLDVDIIAYQDEVGVGKSTVEETPTFFEGLRKAHDRAQRAAIWADVEIFKFEGIVYKSALAPASFQRILKQLEAVSPWVEKILIYQYLGLMNKPGSAAFCGSPASTELHEDYVKWLHLQATKGNP
jgi:hypothetical protein